MCYSAAGASQQQLAMPTLPHFSLACLSLADALLLRRLKLQIPHRWQGWPESSAIVWAVMDDASFTMLASSSSYTLVLTDDGGKKWTVIINTTAHYNYQKSCVHENQSIMAYIICLKQKIRQLTWSHFKMYLSHRVQLVVSDDIFQSCYTKIRHV